MLLLLLLLCCWTPTEDEGEGDGKGLKGEDMRVALRRHLDNLFDLIWMCADVAE